MALYVVLRHRRATEQTYQNVWLDDQRIEVIETPIEIGKLCSEAKERGERVFVHRCGWEGVPPVVCCSAKVQEVSDPYQSNVFVTFADAVPLHDRPQARPEKGQNHYIA